MSLPEWLMEAPPAVPRMGRRRRSWLTGAVKRLASLSVPRERRQGMLRIDPRAALLGFVALIVCATFLTHPFGLALCWALSVFLALPAGVAPRVLGAVSLAVGSLTAIMMLPATSSAVSPGPPLLEVGGIAITIPGVRILAVVMFRTLACLTFGIGLFATNSPEKLFQALRWYRIPGIFVAVLLMTYRYLQVLARAALESHMARQSRVAEEANLGAARRWLGERTGALFARSRGLGEEVHASMVARGFDGQWLPGPASVLRTRDVLWTIVFLAAAGLLVLADRRILS